MDTDAFLLELVDRFARDFSVEQGWQSSPDPADFDRWLGGATGNQITDRFDELGTRLARRYHAQEYSFLFCDWVMNSAYDDLLSRIISDGSIEYPQLFDEIYQAFDDGEWSHRGTWHTSQPVITYTDPAIAAIVARLDQSE